jgi:xanthine/uracil permease
LQVALGGQVIEQVESPGPGSLLAVGLAVSVLVLLTLFGSVPAMAMPVVPVLVAIAVGTGANGLITHLMDVNSATAAIAPVIDADRQLELNPRAAASDGSEMGRRRVGRCRWAEPDPLCSLE